MARSQHRQERLKRVIQYLHSRYQTRGWASGGNKTLSTRHGFEKELRGWSNRNRPGWMQTTPHTRCEDILEEALRQNLILGALDTEFYAGRGGTVVTEVGFSRLCPRTNVVNTNHYVVAGGKGAKQKQFRYGASQYYGDLEALRQEVLEHIDSVDCVLFWNKTEDLAALRSLNVYVPTAKVVDAIDLQMRPSPCGTTEDRYNLAEFCDIQGVPHVGAHCAGNDSHALLTAVLYALGVLGPQMEDF